MTNAVQRSHIVLGVTTESTTLILLKRNDSVFLPGEIAVFSTAIQLAGFFRSGVVFFIG
jgi:hypothetical protein